MSGITRVARIFDLEDAPGMEAAYVQMTPAERILELEELRELALLFNPKLRAQAERSSFKVWGWRDLDAP